MSISGPKPARSGQTVAGRGADHQKRRNRKDFQSNPKKSEATGRGHVFLTLVIFTLANAYRTEIGQELAQAGIRRQRLAWQEANKVLIIAGDFMLSSTWRNC